MNYELMYILPSTLTDEEAQVRPTKISEILIKHGGQITHEVDLGKKKLAYPINHDRYGYYRLVEFTVEPKTVTVLNNALRLSRELLRHQIVLKPVKSEVQLERERSLKEKLAARRAREEVMASSVVSESAPAAPVPALTSEEIDKQIEKIIEEEPQI